MGLGSYLKRCDGPRARVRKENVDVAMLLFHDGIEPVQIFQARHVAYDRSYVALDEGRSLLQLFLSSPRDHDVRTFFHEALGCGQADPAASAGNDRNLSCQFLSTMVVHVLFLCCISLLTAPCGLRISNGAPTQALRVRAAPGRRQRRARWRS